MSTKTKLLLRTASERNNKLADKWSLVHCVSGVLLGWLINPLLALVLMALWEPLEVLVLSPRLARYGIDFGFETWRNSLSDIVFDGVGIVIGWGLLTIVIAPPFHLF